MGKVMALFVSTNTHGSECGTSLEVTPEEWKVMTEQEQDDLVWEYFGDVANSGVEEIGGDMVLHVATSNYDSEDTTSLCTTPEEWKAMTEEEQDVTIGVFFGNICRIQVREEFEDKV